MTIKRFFFKAALLSFVSMINADSNFVSHYMLNFPMADVSNSQTTGSESLKQGRIKQWITRFKNAFTPIHPKGVSLAEKHSILATQFNEVLDATTTNVMPSFSLKDLTLIHNPENSDASLLTRCFKTVTTAGNFFTAFTLANPRVDVARLHTRQNVVQFLSNDAAVYVRIQELLNVIAHHESLLADFWKEGNDFKDKMVTSLDSFKGIPQVDKINKVGFYNHLQYVYDYFDLITNQLGINPFKSFMNQNTQALFLKFNKFILEKNLKNIIENFPEGEQKQQLISQNQDAIRQISNASIPYTEMIKRFPHYYKSVLTGKESSINLVELFFGNSFILYSLRKVIEDPNYLKDHSYISLVFGGLQAYNLVKALERFNQKKMIFDVIHTQMNSVAAIVRAMRELSDIVESHQELRYNLEYANKLNRYGNSRSGASSKMKELLSLLETKTFDYTTQFALRGRVKTAYKLLQEVKDELFPGLIAVAEIDTLASVSELYNTYKNTDTPWCFVEYITESATPVIRIDSMWNPMIVGKPVTNSIELGTSSAPRNVILTGPNAGGKTTFLKGIVLSAILGQTVGIAPATSCQMTLFSKINTYMSIVDNISTGDSLFMAEVKRAEKLVRMAQENDGFTLSIIDELFSGTSPEHGQAASFAIAKKLGNISTSITLISTHFIDTMKKLEEETGNFRNYKVNAEIKADGTIYYPFTVVPGVSTINVVDAIFHTIGFDGDIIQDFQNTIAAGSAQ